jgi:hypothetical protein
MDKVHKGMRKCAHCGKPFRPKNQIQKYCTRVTCHKARIGEYMKHYMSAWKRKHSSYWRTPRMKEYFRKWRIEHKDYFKKWRKKNKPAGAAPGGKTPRR